MGRKSAKPPRSASAGPGLLLFALAAIICAVFVPTLRSGFVYDSQSEIVLWNWLHDARNILTVVSFHIMTLDVLDFNRPVAVAWLMFNVMFFGPDPMGYHLTSILLHVAVAGLAFLFIRHILALTRPGSDPARRDAAAFGATLLFALHPLVTEAVCEPANCKDSLATLFGLGAVLLAARHRPGFGAGDPARLALVPFLCLLSVGSKELGVAFPVLLAAYWLIFRRAERDLYWLVVILGSALTVTLFLGARFAYAHVPSEVFLYPPTYPAGTMLRTFFLLQPQIFALYLVNLVCPLWLCADYNAYSVRFLPLWFAVPMVLLAASALVWRATRDRPSLLAAVFLAAALLPVSNLVPLFRPAADRFLYAPLIALALLVASVLDSEVLARPRYRRRLTFGIMLAVLALLIPLTVQRERAWFSPITLWQDEVKKNPTSFIARTNLPIALLSAGRVQEARTATEAALSTSFRTWPWLWFDYALELEKLGDHAGAKQAAHHAIALKPDITDAAKMSRTLQGDPALVREFDRIAAPLPAGLETPHPR